MRKSGLLLIGALLSVKVFASADTSTGNFANEQENITDNSATPNTPDKCPGNVVIDPNSGHFVAKDTNGKVIWDSMFKAKDRAIGRFEYVSIHLVDRHDFGFISCKYKTADDSDNIRLFPAGINLYISDEGNWRDDPSIVGHYKVCTDQSSCTFTIASND